MAWEQEVKDAVIADYQAADPTPETTTEIVKQLAEEYDQSPNGVRMVLTKAGVYVTKAPAPSSSKSSGATGGGRVSKAEAIEALSAAIESLGHEVDESIVSKLTGKAATYFTSILTPSSDND